MASYIPSTVAEQKAMLEEIGLHEFDDLYQAIPSSVKIDELDLPNGKSEREVFSILEKMAAKNTVAKECYRGAGAYRHYIPSLVKSVTSKEEFVTSYTPYQAEISQGVLQSIFEYQTMICELTGMEVSNASVYDGATAAAEAVAMCVDKKHQRVLVSACLHPQVIQTIKTYCFGSGIELEVIPEKEGLTDVQILKDKMGEDVACVMIQQPNFYGNLEEAGAIGEITHTTKAKFIMSCNPIALGVIKTPREWGADIAIGEGQPLGLSLAFGGPYLGYMATTEALMRKLPGRIVGQTTDHEGRRAFVLTLQAREQHIRREKASSNICSNEAWCALCVSVYLSVMGKHGLVEVARQCHSKAVYLKNALTSIGMKPMYNHPFFHEFVMECSVSSDVLLDQLQESGILGGYPIDEHHILWCATEMNTKEEIDKMVAVLKEVLS